MKRLPLLWRVFLSTSLFTTVLFVLIGYLVQRHALTTTAVMLEEELQSSLRAYESLWRARADHLASVSKLVSGMPDVRAAFGTGDRATILDTAGEIWGRASQDRAIFLVTDPDGKVIASLGGGTGPGTGPIECVAAVSQGFPRQASGFTFLSGQLFQVVITPVYVQSARGPALINVLLAGFPADQGAAEWLSESMRGTEIHITAGGRTIASTLRPGSGAQYSELATPLTDVTGQPIGQIRFLRPFTASPQRLADLRLQIAGMWAAAILFGLLVTFTVARRLLRPIRLLDTAANEVGRGNYEYRVPLDGDDEMGRLGRAFNAMCKSIHGNRQELIRQERVNTLGRIATSVVHDLRNPLAAIYSGAELLVDSEGLPANHTQRLASNIYRASRQVLNLLDDLMGLARGSAPAAEVCRLAEVVEDAWASVTAKTPPVDLTLGGDTSLELPIARARVERVFVNLFENAVQAMPSGGSVRVTLDRDGDTALVTVSDSGPGVPEQIRSSLFQPFTTAGKSNGLGLGLALSRQTLLDHGGNLTLEESDSGACFRVRLPLAWL